MSQIQLLAANLASAVTESLLYGVYLVVGLLVLYLASQSNGPSNERCFRLLSPLQLATFGLFLTVTSHWVLNVVRLFLAFKNGAGPQVFYSDHSHITEVLKYCLLVLSVALGDIFLIHRLWVVWRHSTLIVLLPATTLVGLIVFGIGLVHQLTQYTLPENIYQMPYHRWSTGICFFSLLTNVYTSGLIIWKLWWTTHAVRSLGCTESGGAMGFTVRAVNAFLSLNSPLIHMQQIILIFLESAAIITVCGLIHAVSYQRQSNLQFVLIDCMPPVIGISSLLIHVRMYLERTRLFSPRTVPTTSVQFATMQISRKDDESEFEVPQSGSTDSDQEPI
ncbi:hypothetical protein C8J57DRAFT_471818 [Mycena rebaudengoi]|nr:hypothetical protein C8J57DRAFT_471818 [Mycena rebaudengoi]